jgi:hypothetical protein
MPKTVNPMIRTVPDITLQHPTMIADSMMMLKGGRPIIHPHRD